MGSFRLTVFRLFVVALAIWLGGGVFHAISTHPAWCADPVGWVKGAAPQEGSVNPWPYTTAFVGLMTILSLPAILSYGGPGRNTALFSLAGTIAVLVATAVYFVPALGEIFGKTATHADAEIVGMSRMWVGLNLARLVVLLGLFYAALVAIGRFERKA